MSAAGALELREEGEALLFILSGRLDAASTGRLWRQAFDGLDRKRPRRIGIDATRVDYCDGWGIGLIVELRRRQGVDTEVRGLAPQFKSLLDLFPVEPGAPPAPKPRPVPLPVEVGRGTAALVKDLYTQIAFSGELLATMARVALHEDLTHGDAPAAVIEIQFLLLRVSSDPTAVLHQKTYRQGIVAASAEPAAMVKAWCEGLVKILGSLEEDLAKTKK